MKIIRNKLHRDDGSPVRFVQSPNRGGTVDPKYFVIYCTATPSAQAAINTLTDPNAKASAHVVIARNGEITQLVPFNRIAWHAGE